MTVAVRLVALCTSLLVLALAPAAAHAADPDRTGTVSSATPTFTWDSEVGAGYNTARDPKACSKDVETYCDVTLLKVDAPAGAVGELKVDIGNYFGPQCTPLDGQNAPCDFSLWVYQSDEKGTPGKNVGSSINDSGEPEDVTVKTARAGYYLVIVYYYTVAASSFTGTATLGALTQEAVELPPVEGPPAPAAPAGLPTSGDFSADLALAGKASAKAGIPARVTCTVACTGQVVAEVSAANARKAGLGKKKLVLGKAAVSVSTPEGSLVTVKVAKAIAKKLKKAGVKVTLRAALKDAGGIGASPSKTLTLRRA